ncbi:heterokaryon incompatibility protein-domain-containing protein [Xylaria acuta]|nr:heterokaryon incompatibility protein-domain-containing protein [Xylaria acuta]
MGKSFPSSLDIRFLCVCYWLRIMSALCDLIEYMYEPVENLDPKPQLCDSCRMINFHRVLNPPPLEERALWGTWHVDDLEQREVSLSSPCVLCQVLLAVYYGSPSTAWELRATINPTLGWRNSLEGISSAVTLFTCERQKFHFAGRHIRDIENIIFCQTRPWTLHTHTGWDIQGLQQIFSRSEDRISSRICTREETPLIMLNTPVPPGNEGATREGVRVQKDVPVLRLIDCANDNLEVLDADCSMEWVALSYVWSLTRAGNIAALNGKLRSIGDGPSSNSTENCTRSLLISSQLIQDAAAVVKSLGYRYLWVDQLCINQSNPEERHSQIRQMASIYSQAKLTIVSVSDTGYLPGVKEARKPSETTITLRDNESGNKLFIFKPIPNINTDLNGSLWNTRGWTFQEAQLSSKLLYFTDSRVLLHYRPNDKIWSFFSGKLETNESDSSWAMYIRERGWVVGSLLYPSRRRDLSKGDFWLFHAVLLDLIEEYTAKQLSYPEDTLNAIRGILQLFGKPQYILFSLQGLPCFPNRLAGQRYNTDGKNLLGYSLCLGLMWFSTSWKTSKPRDSFPSWSWTGWMGKAQWIRNLDLLPYADAATVQSYAKVVAVYGSCGSIRGLDDDALGHFWDCSDSGKEAKGLYIRARLISNLVSRLIVREGPMSEPEGPWVIKNLYCHVEDTSTTGKGLREKLLPGVHDVVLMMEKRYHGHLHHGPRIEAYALVVQWDQGQNSTEKGIRIARRVGMVILEAKWKRDEVVRLLWNSPGLSKEMDMLLM